MVEKAQAFGNKARKFTKELVFGKEVQVIEKKKGPYGRVIGEVAVGEGASLNEALLEAGLAWWDHKYAKEPKWAQLEAEARRKGRGLWRDRQAVPPWVWRKKK